MPGDIEKRKLSGDPARMAARTFNGLLDTRETAQRARRLWGGQQAGDDLASCLVYAVNASGANCPMYSVVEIASKSLATQQVEFVKAGGTNGQDVYGIAVDPIPASAMGRIAIAGGSWPLRATGAAVGDQLGPVDASWTAGAGETWEVLRESVDDVALVRFLGGGGGTPPVYLEVRTSDPTSPIIGEMWLRSDL